MKIPSFGRRFMCTLAGLICPGAMISGQVPQVAPLNPEFEKCCQNGPKVQSGANAEVPNYGLIPIPIDLSYLAEQVAPQKFERQLALTPVYDLRTIGKVNGIRDQGPYGTCWAYATFGSLESFLLPSEDRDFSENNLVNLDGFDYSFDAGGHFLMSMATGVRF